MLRNKTLILTGASRGIGRALALALARRGVRLVLCARDAPLLEETRKDCQALAIEALGPGAHVLAVAGDAADDAVVRALVDRAEGLGDYFGFIHAAGVLLPGPTLWELDDADFDAVVGAGLRAAWRLVQRGAPPLLRRGAGLCVFFGSGAAQRAMPGLGLYCAAKAAEEHLARQLAAEAPALTTFVYRPGVVATRMQEQARQAEGGAGEAVRRFFTPYLERGLLLTPAGAAAGLLRYLDGDWSRLRGAT
ncbi:MAG: SDR family NAD(P)-dependent oxidoreductase, partial [Desulfovibrionaceae bacterium]